MKEILFQLAFKKAEKQSGSTTKNGLATHLEQVFDGELDFRVNKITFSRYYEQFIENKNSNATNPKTDLLNKLAEYLCYASYEDFVKNNENFPDEDTPTIVGGGNSMLTILKKYWLLITIVLLILITIFIVLQLNQQRWMVWNETEYIPVNFDLEKYDLDQLKIYNENKINHFKKVTVKCDSTEFIKPDGTVNIWYQKNQHKELEFFTATGIHPETGKTLRPITNLIIKKYICSKDSLTINE